MVYVCPCQVLCRLLVAHWRCLSNVLFFLTLPVFPNFILFEKLIFWLVNEQSGSLFWPIQWDVGRELKGMADPPDGSQELSSNVDTEEQAAFG